MFQSYRRGIIFNQFATQHSAGISLPVNTLPDVVYAFLGDCLKLVALVTVSFVSQESMQVFLRSQCKYSLGINGSIT